MGLQPEESEHAGSRLPTRLLQRRALASAGVATAALTLGWLGADLAGARLYRQLRPWVERLAGRAMGHPLELGPYRGLRPWGLRAGASRFRPGPDNPSTIEVEAVSVALDPLRSLRQRSWVLQIELRQARVQLRRNSRGAYWVLGPQPPGRQPPALGLHIQLDGAAQVSVAPASGSVLRFALSGDSTVLLRQRRLELNAAARLLQRGERGGALSLRGQGQWLRGQWQAGLALKQVPLQPLVPLLPTGLQRQFAGRLDGQATGQLMLQDPGRVGRRPPGAARRCQGSLAVDGARWRAAVLPAPLLAQQLTLRCQEQQLRLLPSSLAMGPWTGRATGGFDLGGPAAGRLGLNLTAQNRRAGHRLQARLSGPWRHPDLVITGRLRPPEGLDPIALRAQLALDGRQPRFTVLASQLSLRSGNAQLQASGQLWPALAINSQRLLLGPDLWRNVPAARNLIGVSSPLQGQLQVLGSLADPRLRLRLQQANNPLLGSAQALLQWSRGVLRLESLEAPQLTAQGRWPLAFRGERGLVPGSLALQLDLRRYPLARLTPLLGSGLRGFLDARGRIEGPLRALRPELDLLVEQPGAGPVALSEAWQGRLQALGAGGGTLRLEPLAPARFGFLEALLDRRWLPVSVRLQRSGGSLSFSGSPRRYHWRAEAFPLEGLQLAMGPRSTLQPVEGLLSGSGWLDLQPLWMQGRVRVERPVLLGVRGRQLLATGSFRDRRFELTGQLQPESEGRIGLRLRGERGGPLWSRFEGRRLGSRLLRQLLEAWPLWRGAPPPSRGRAAELGSLAIDTLGGSLSDQLAALALARERLAAAATPSPGERPRPDDLEGQLDADLTLVGPSLERLHIDLTTRGHLWLRREDRDVALSAEPVVARLQGPLRQGAGSFSLQNLPLSLLALLTPVPAGLRGGLSAQGSYRLGGKRPELEAVLALQQASLRGESLALERGLVRLESEAIALDWSLRGGKASNSLELRGRVPLRLQDSGLELRVASRGDGLRFLAVLGGQGVQWQQGEADLQVLVRGSLEDPIANGFLRFRDGVLQVAGQTMRQLDATLLFDFQELELQQLTARVGARGSVSGSGQLALFTPRSEAPRLLKLRFSQAPFSVPRLRAQADGELLVSGALLRPTLGGELQLSRGSLNVQPGQLATEAEPTKPVTVRQLVESQWDFSRPLVVMGADLESNASRDMRQAVPDLPMIGLNGLRLRLGPDLRVTVPNVLNFNTGGVLTLNGRLDPSIRASGVVRLLNGRLGLFTTTFSLDPDAPNVAVFTPSLGLIPYLDIALRTKVSDTLQLDSADRSSIYDWNASNTTSALDQLRLVKVTITATGPADRLAENIRLSSSPPLPEERLIALIGGNSLVGLVGGNATTALATVLGQSLLSPVVGGLSEAFGQRLSFALYPTYFAPAEAVAVENRSRRLPSQLVLGAEIGLDVTERFNFSVLAAPNRSDIPPQVTLRYQASDRLGLQTSVDSEGRWQGQLQLFFRF
jgi:translocation and assembly module TamB